MDDRRPPSNLLWRCCDGFTPTRRSSLALHVYPEKVPEAHTDQPGQIGRPRPRPTGLGRALKTGAAIYEADLITAAKAKREACKSTAASAAASQCQRSTASILSMMSMDAPDAIWICWTPLDQLQHPECSNHRLSVRLSSPPMPLISVDRPPEPLLPASTTTSSSTSIPSTFVAAAPVPIITAHNPATPTNINFPDGGGIADRSYGTYSFRCALRTGGLRARLKPLLLNVTYDALTYMRCTSLNPVV
ncbi:hypothetical protein SprV_0602200500 [Sparganum proliferum]